MSVVLPVILYGYEFVGTKDALRGASSACPQQSTGDYGSFSFTGKDRRLTIETTPAKVVAESCRC
jgi:hypothetical protein